MNKLAHWMFAMLLAMVLTSSARANDMDEIFERSAVVLIAKGGARDADSNLLNCPVYDDKGNRIGTVSFGPGDGGTTISVEIEGGSLKGTLSPQDVRYFYTADFGNPDWAGPKHSDDPEQYLSTQALEVEIAASQLTGTGRLSNVVNIRARCLYVGPAGAEQSCIYCVYIFETA